MTDPWWGREAGPDRRPLLAEDAAGTASVPELLPSGRGKVRDFVSNRIGAFTPEWTRRDRRDAGVTLVRLFGSLMEPVLERLNRLPEKFLVEELRIAGVRRLPATAASALLAFTVAASATDPIEVPEGFQASAAPAGGEGDPVVFETRDTVTVTSAQIAEVHVEDGGLIDQVDLAGLPGQPFHAFGPDPRGGSALWIALSGQVVPYPILSLGVMLASPAGQPAPASSGALRPPPQLPSPVVRWEAFDGGRVVPVEVDVDETRGLQESGVIRLRPPERWRPGRPAGPKGRDELRWLRATLVQGEYGRPPSIAALQPNVVRAIAARTIRNEPLEPLPEGGTDARTRMRLSQTPVLPGSVVIEVDEAAPQRDVFGVTVGAGPAGTTRWIEVDDLSSHGQDAQVFVVDHASGVVTFGDGVHGATVPGDSRSIRVIRYQVGGGAAGAVEADAITSMVTSIPFVTGVTNPFPASGGVDTESNEEAVQRGTDELRSRGRAVTESDYALMARRTPGANVARAKGIANFHPDYAGLPVPGVVTVLVVPPRTASTDPPIPDELSLRAVAEHLRRTLAPVGVEVVAASPRYHLVRVEARIVVDPRSDVGESVRNVRLALDDYLDPLRGGDLGRGWPFGGPLRYTAVLRHLLATVSSVVAVPQMDFVVDGVRGAVCSDASISRFGLLWPQGHEIVPVPPNRDTDR